MKTKYYFIYGRSSRNQLSKMFRYRRCAATLKRRLASPGQYAIGQAIASEEYGIERTVPARIRLKPDLIHTKLK